MAAAAAAAAAAQQTIAGKQAQLRARLASCHQHIHARPQPPPASYSSSSCSAPAPAPAAAGAQPSCLCPPPAITSHICISRPHPKCRFDGWLCRSCPFPPFCLSRVCARACVCMPEPPIRAAHPCNSPQPPRRRRWRVNGAPHSPPSAPPGTLPAPARPARFTSALVAHVAAVRAMAALVLRSSALFAAAGVGGGGSGAAAFYPHRTAAAAAVGGGGGGGAVVGGAAGGSTFLRVHWVAVPQALRARRVNRIRSGRALGRPSRDSSRRLRRWGRAADVVARHSVCRGAIGRSAHTVAHTVRSTGYGAWPAPSSSPPPSSPWSSRSWLVLPH
jgi:hypothetical protein